jgi:hypothetical protein
MNVLNRPSHLSPIFKTSRIMPVFILFMAMALLQNSRRSNTYFLSFQNSDAERVRRNSSCSARTTASVMVTPRCCKAHGKGSRARRVFEGGWVSLGHRSMEGVFQCVLARGDQAFKLDRGVPQLRRSWVDGPALRERPPSPPILRHGNEFQIVPDRKLHSLLAPVHGRLFKPLF